jgi:hypothetical protein
VFEITQGVLQPMKIPKSLIFDRERPVRYVVTHVNKNGVRVLTFANQGRHHFDKREDAQAWIEACRKDSRSMEILSNGRGDTLEVRAVECYGPGGDSTKTVFYED